MSRVYLVSSDQHSRPFSRVHCMNEETELQNLLEKNLDLIPGDQVDPDNPRRWLLIKRELSVEDPATGEGRWSLDFLLVDQDGVLTLVECKRFRDVRARREVIGQMFDYVANTSFYLSRDAILAHLEARAQADGSDMESLLLRLQPASGESLDAFLSLIENNISEGLFRLVFFMEEAPYELRSIVEFLNKQMERTEVLLVEARQYQNETTRVVVPVLWDYTEQARRVKKTVSMQMAGSRREWNYELFREDLEATLDESSAKAVLTLHDFAKSLPNSEIRWGTGKERGSFNLVFPCISERSILSVFSHGKIWLNYGWLNRTDSENAFREIYTDQLSRVDEFGINPKKENRALPAAAWIPAADQLKQAISKSLQQFSASFPQAC